MSQELQAKILRMHFSESDRYGDKPLYEAVVAKCREMRIAGATVFRGLEGYGETGELHTGHLVRHDQPIVVTVVDSAENINGLAPVLAEMMDTGLITSSKVRCIRVERSKRSGGGAG